MRRARNLQVLLILLLIILVLFIQFRSGNEPESLPLNELADHIARGDVARLFVAGDAIEIEFRDGTSARSRKEPGKTVAEQMAEYGVAAERLSPKEIEIRVESAGLLSEANLAVVLVSGTAGAALGAAFVLLVQKARAGLA